MDRRIGNYPETLAFIISVAFYLLVLCTAFYQAYVSDEDAKKYTSLKDSFMDVYVVEREIAAEIQAPKRAEEKVDNKKDEEQNDKEEKSITTPKPTPVTKPQEEPLQKPKVEEKVVEKIEEKAKVVELNTTKPLDKPKPVIKNLFAELNSDKLDEASKKEAIQSRKKSDSENTSANKKASDTLDGKKSDKATTPKAGSTGEYDEFKGKVEDILRNIWSSYNAMVGNDATIELVIGANGRISTSRIVQLSYDTEFNQKVRDFMVTLEGVQFPNPPGGSYKHKYKLEDLMQNSKE